MTKVITKIAPIIGSIGAFFVSKVNNEVIHQLLSGISFLQGLMKLWHSLTCREDDSSIVAKILTCSN